MPSCWNGKLVREKKKKYLRKEICLSSIFQYSKIISQTPKNHDTGLKFVALVRTTATGSFSAIQKLDVLFQITKFFSPKILIRNP